MVFTTEEKRILYLILHYFSNPKIAEVLKCSISTVKNKIRIIFAKAQARNRLELFKVYYSDPDKFFAAEETKEEESFEILKHSFNFESHP